METQIRLLAEWADKHSSYPTYEEWKLISTLGFSESTSKVLILPMRNGNSFVYSTSYSFDFCSYPTYEEWKHTYTVPYVPLVYVVLILPMRNGNQV